MRWAQSFAISVETGKLLVPKDRLDIFNQNIRGRVELFWIDGLSKWSLRSVNDVILFHH